VKSALDQKFDREHAGVNVSRYVLGVYRVDLTANRDRVAWVITVGDRIVGKGISTAADSAFDVLRALSRLAMSVSPESKSDSR
jgi:hypothetical protein